jgi:hypothetical protein
MAQPSPPRRPLPRASAIAKCVHMSPSVENTGRLGFFFHAAGAEPLINRPFCPDKLILAGFSGSFANAQYQRSQAP